MRRALIAALGLSLSACITMLVPPPPPPPREHVESLWDFAPKDASMGVVFHAGSFTKALALAEVLRANPTVHPEQEKKEKEKAAKEEPSKMALPPLASIDEWKRAGFDPAADAAAFAWPDPKRGALFILPVADRAAFRSAFKATTRVDGAREIDAIVFGYECTTVVERYACAKSIADVDAAAARHSSPVTSGGEHPDPDDEGDVEVYATAAAPQVASAAEAANDYGKLHGVAASLRIRDDGATLRVHGKGEMFSDLARSLAGGPPLKSLVTATGAPTVLRVHLDPMAASKASKTMDDDEKHELVEQLTGDAEITTSGRGLLGLHAAFDLKSPARVEAYLKKKCDEATGFHVGSGLRSVTVTEHGCRAIFDSKLALMPIFLDPIPVVADVHGDVFTIDIGDARAPSAAERTTSLVAPNTDAAFALEDAEAIVGFTTSPWIGPDVGAGAAFSKLSIFVGDDDAARVDAFNDIAAHVAQAFVSSRVNESGAVVSAGFITFAHDPPDALAAYNAALVARAAGDVATYHARLAEIERRFPTSLAARRAVAVRTPGPWIGAGALAFGSIGAWLDVLDAVVHLKPK